MEESREPQEEAPQQVPGAAGPEPEAGGEIPTAEEPAADQAVEAPPDVADPLLQARPASDGQRSLLPTVVAVLVVAFAAVGIFVLGMVAHALTTDDDGGGGGAIQVVQASPSTAGAQPTPAPRPTPQLVEATVDDDPARGPEDAAVTVIEFSDFQCPFCARFSAQTLPTVLENYGDRVRFVFRDFPLNSIHPFAAKAAEAAECADDQESFWDYHDLLFENQNALDVDSLKGHAASLDLDVAAFDECLDSGKYTEEVAKDLEDGAAAGVRGTPAFFINGRLISGAQPYQVFAAAIDAALAEAEE